MPDVMEHMADVHRSLVAHAGKLSGETFKSQVAFVIEIWENWYVDWLRFDHFYGPS